MNDDVRELAPNEIRSREATAKAVELRIQGHDWDTIGRTLDLPAARARKLVIKALREFDLRTEEGIEELRDVTTARFERMIRRTWLVAFPTETKEGKVVAAPPNLDAVKVLLEIIRDQTKFLALGAAKEKIVIDASGIEEYAKSALGFLLGFIDPKDRQLALDGLERMRGLIGHGTEPADIETE